MNFRNDQTQKLSETGFFFMEFIISETTNSKIVFLNIKKIHDGRIYVNEFDFFNVTYMNHQNWYVSKLVQNISKWLTLNNEII